MFQAVNVLSKISPKEFAAKTHVDLKAEKEVGHEKKKEKFRACRMEIHISRHEKKSKEISQVLIAKKIKLVLKCWRAQS